MIAQFIVDNTGQNAIDDGTIATLESNFKVAIASVGRIRLTSDFNLYISPTGNDSASGLTASSPMLTLQAAYTKIYQQYDLNGYTAQINLANGTYPAGLYISGPLVGQTGASGLYITGNLTSPASVILNSTTSQVNTISAVNAALIFVRGLTLNSSGTGQGGSCLFAQSAGVIQFSTVIFGTALQAHLTGNLSGSFLCNAPYTISGSAREHIELAQGATLNVNGAIPFTITVAGTPNFSGAFCAVDGSAEAAFVGASFSGAATGTRYIGTNGGYLNTGGGGINFFPGSVAGTSTTGYYS